jgi:hypothetical protein
MLSRAISDLSWGFWLLGNRGYTSADARPGPVTLTPKHAGARKVTTAQKHRDNLKGKDQRKRQPSLHPPAHPTPQSASGPPVNNVSSQWSRKHPSIPLPIALTHPPTPRRSWPTPEHGIMYQPTPHTKLSRPSGPSPPPTQHPSHLPPLAGWRRASRCC